MGLSNIFFYVEANIACSLILIMLLVKITRGIDRQLSTLVIRRMMIAMLCYFFSDTIWALCLGQIIPASRHGIYAATLIPYVLLVLCGYFWFYYGESIQQNKNLLTKKGTFISVLPMIISTVAIIIGTTQEVVFYLDDQGNLQYGPMYIFLLIVPIGYMSYSSIKAFYKSFTHNRYLDHTFYFVIGIFPVIPIVCGILQAIFITVPIMCYGATLSVLIVYITSLENLVSMDSLTKLNNRAQLQRHLTNKMKLPSVDKRLFLLMTDVDKFKDINDNYGHVEGDRALMRVANAMREACKKYRNNTFIARYGGDEFVIVAEMETLTEVNQLAELIKANIINANKQSDASYNLTVSIGISEYDYANPVSIPKLIAEADKGLYEMKAKRQ